MPLFVKIFLNSMDIKISQQKLMFEAIDGIIVIKNIKLTKK